MSKRPSLDWNSQYIDKLLVYLSEIVREARQTNKPLYEFVDLGFVKQLDARRNHVILGRRGSGKSVLLRQLESKVASTKTYTVLIDVEQIADKSYPNLIIRILKEIFESFHAHTQRGLFGRLQMQHRNLSKQLESEIKGLETLYRKPEKVDQTQRKSEETENKGEVSGQLSNIQSILTLAANISRRSKAGVDIEERAPREKIELLFSNITEYRDLILKWLSEMGYDSLYLLIDDFYQINRLHQPLITDYLKRLTRGIPCFLKIATVRNRSLLFWRDKLGEAGLQAENDYTSLELDFALDDFFRAKRFLSDIFANICRGRLGPVKPSFLFDLGEVDPMDILTEASGGNPRDFINLLHAVIASKRRARSKTPILLSDILIAVVNYYSVIKSDMERTYEDSEILLSFLKDLVEVCQENKDIGFYITNQDLKSFPAVAALLGQLTDSRLMHLLTSFYDPPNTPGGPATVYIVSMGIYCEYLKGQPTTLLMRQQGKIAYPKLPVVELSSRYAERVPDLVMLQKAAE